MRENPHIPNNLGDIPPSIRLKSIEDERRKIQQKIWNAEKDPQKRAELPKLQEALAILNDSENNTKKSPLN